MAELVVDEVWNNDDHWRVRRLVANDCRFIDCGRSDGEAPIRLVDLVNAYKALVPDMTLRIQRQMAERCRITTEWEAGGRHIGSVGGLRATGRPVTLRGKMITDGERGGRLISGSWDMRHLLEQVCSDGAAVDRMCRPRVNEVAIRARYQVSGIPLLLFPSLSLPGWLTWRRVIDAFCTKKPTITFECGATRRAFQQVRSTGYRLDRENASLLRTLKYHRIDGPYDIVGHSIGGALALDFALDHPELTRTVTLIEPGLPWLLRATGSLTDEIVHALRWRRTFYRSISPARYAQFLQTTYREDGYDPRRSPRWPLMRAYRGNMSYRAAIFRHEDTPARLCRLQCPVLLIQGRNSDCVHKAVMRVLRTLLPHAVFLELAGGHVPHYGAGSTTFISYLSDFLQTAAVSAGQTA